MQLQISERRVLLMFGDIVAVNIAVVIALRIWAFVGKIPFDEIFIARNAYWFPLFSVLWLLLAGLNGFFDLHLALRFKGTLARLILIEVQIIIIYILLFFLSPPETLPRLFMMYYGIASFILILIWRMWRPFLFGWRGFKRRVLVIGADWAAQTIIEVLQKEAPDMYEIAGIIGNKNQTGSKLDGVPILGTGAELVQIARREQIREVVVVYHRDLPADLFEGIMACYERGITVTPMPLLYERLTGRIPVEHVGNQWTVILPLQEKPFFNPYPLLKRLLDIVLAVTGLVIFACLLPVIALAMQIDSPGSIFYRQERVGKAGRKFKIIKLRSMIPDAEKYSGPLWSFDNDPRITTVGRFLRKSRLDEVPQLLNVLRGEMSMVGPRPERPNFVEALAEDIPFYRARLAVKPGVTGWAQVRYKYGSTKYDALVKLQHDLYYIRHQSIVLDTVILFRTIGKMLAFEGS